VKKTSNGTTTYYPFPHYEVSGSTVTKYYFFAGQRVAMKVGGELYYLHPDHLGSTVQVTRSGATFVANQGYSGYGKYRLGGALPTDHRYTGQKLDIDTGLMYYGARYYDRQVGTFISPDTLVPDPANIWDYNRFGYGYGNPVKYNDPSGHCPAPPASMGPAICMALFIEPARVEAGLFTLQGDGRSFDSNSDPAQSRGYAWISLAADQVEIHMNPSTYILPASVAGHEAYLETEASSQNRWTVRRGEQGEITVAYDLVVSGPLEQSGVAPHINGTVTFRPDGKGSYKALFERDGFPWAEAYYHDGKGKVQTIFQAPATRGNPHDLFAIEPNINFGQRFARLIGNRLFGQPLSRNSNDECRPGDPC
jgi:RHS repeat-associated protein